MLTVSLMNTQEDIKDEKHRLKPGSVHRKEIKLW